MRKKVFLIFILLFTLAGSLYSQDSIYDQVEKIKDFMSKSKEYRAINNYKAAIYWAREAVKVQEQYFSDQPLPQIMVNFLLGALSYENEDYLEAERCLRFTVNTFRSDVPEEILKQSNELVIIKIQSLNNLGEIYRINGNYSEAESLYNEAARYGSFFWGKDNPNYTMVINNLASLYLSKGDYSQSETLYKEVIRLNEENSIFTGPSYLYAINNLGELYRQLGNFSKAESLYNQVIEKLEDPMGKDKTIYINELNNLGLVYKEQSKYDKALSQYLKALIFLTNSDRNSLLYATCLLNIAGLYREQGEYKEAEPYSLQAVELYKNLLGEDNPDYLQSLHNLAGLYFYLDNYSAAEKFYLEVIEKRGRILGKFHPDYIKSLSSLGRLYTFIGKIDSAKPYMLEASEKNKRNIKTLYNFLPESERNLYWEQNGTAFEMLYPSFFYDLYKITPDSMSYFYNNTLFSKNLLLNTSLHFQDNILHKNDSVSLKL